MQPRIWYLAWISSILGSTVQLPAAAAEGPAPLLGQSNKPGAVFNLPTAEVLPAGAFETAVGDRGASVSWGLGGAFDIALTGSGLGATLGGKPFTSSFGLMATGRYRFLKADRYQLAFAMNFGQQAMGSGAPVTNLGIGFPFTFSARPNLLVTATPMLFGPIGNGNGGPSLGLGAEWALSDHVSVIAKALSGGMMDGRQGTETAASVGLRWRVDRRLTMDFGLGMTTDDAGTSVGLVDLGGSWIYEEASK